VNENIPAEQVRVLDVEKQMVGMMPLREGIAMAQDQGLDLVMISKGDVPVARIMDKSKYKYELEKKQREVKKAQAAVRVNIKELKVRYNIDKHDYDVRLKQARKFLESGDKVKFSLQLRGRELDFQDLAQELLERIREDLSELGSIDGRVQFEGKKMLMVLSPLVSKSEKLKEKKEKQSKGASKSDEFLEDLLDEATSQEEPKGLEDKAEVLEKS